MQQCRALRRGSLAVLGCSGCGQDCLSPLYCAGLRDKLCQAEIENLGVAASGDEDVGCLDVPMDDAFGVGRIQAVRNLRPRSRISSV